MRGADGPRVGRIRLSIAVAMTVAAFALQIVNVFVDWEGFQSVGALLVIVASLIAGRAELAVPGGLLVYAFNFCLHSGVSGDYAFMVAWAVVGILTAWAFYSFLRARMRADQEAKLWEARWEAQAKRWKEREQ